MVEKAPTREQLYAALERADAQGDVEAAREITAAINAYSMNPVPVEEVDAPPSQVEQELSPWNKLKDAGKFVAGSMTRGLAELPAMLAASFVPPDKFGSLNQPIDFSTRNAVQESITEFLPSLIGAEKPQTSGARIADAGIRAAMPGALFGKGAALIGALSGLGAQGGMEAVASAGGGKGGQLLAGLAGGLGFGGFGSLVGAARPRPLLQILAESVEDPEALRRAAEAARAARAQGITSNPLDWMPKGNEKLRDIQQSVVALGGGDKIVANIRKQSPQIQEKGNALVNQLPGEIKTPEAVSRQAQDAATEVFREQQRQAVKGFDDILASETAKRDIADMQRLLAAEIEAQEARAVQQNVREGVAPMLAEERAAIQEQMKAELARMTEQQRLDLLRAGREVSNETAFGVDELGDWGTLLAARETLLKGDKAKRTWTAQELRERGVDDALIGEMITKRQPTVKGTGVIQTEGPVQGPPTSTREGNVARSIQKLADADAATAERALEAVQAQILGRDILKASDVEKAKSLILSLMAEVRGNKWHTADLQSILNQINGVRTSKELHNLIVGVKNSLPSVRALGSSAADLSETAVVGKAVKMLKDLRNKTTPAYGLADEAYKAAKAERAELYKNTHLGRIATRGGSSPEQEANRRVIFDMLARGENPKATNSQLRSTLEELQKADPESVTSAVKSYLSELLSEVFGKGKTGLENPRPGEALTAKLGDASNPMNDARLNGLRIALDVAAKGKGITASERLALQRGVDNLIEIANANARTPRAAASMTAQELRDYARNLKGFGPALRLIGVAPGSAVARLISDLMGGKTLRKLDDMFSDPDQIELLIELGKGKKVSPGQARIIAMVAGSSMARTQEPEE